MSPAVISAVAGLIEADQAGDSFVITINPGVMLVLATFFCYIGIYVARFILRGQAMKNQHLTHKIYRIKLPKEKPGDNQKEFTVQQLHEEIARAETIFSAIGGLRAQRGLRQWFLGRTDHISFEIVVLQKFIYFYVAVEGYLAEYLEQQIQAHYPEAVMEEIEDYNIFSPSGVIIGGYVKTNRHFIFPIRTYKKMDVDPMSSIVNALSKLSEDEGMAVQFVVRSAHGRWHRKLRAVGVYVRKGRPLSDAIRLASRNPFLNEFLHFFQAVKPSEMEAKNSGANDPYRMQRRQMTAMEEESLKNIEEKNAKAGLDANIRVVVCARDKGQANLYLDNIASAFGQYNYYDYGNSFGRKAHRPNQHRLFRDFIYRRFDERNSFLLNTEELASLFHLPNRWIQTPTVAWLTARNVPAPLEIPDEGIVLGKNVFRGVSRPIHIKRADRRRHTYLIGKSGVGKSQLMAGMAIQDIINGEGVCVIDPHGDLVEEILARVPASRAEDVVLFAPADIERPLALNLMEFDARYPEQKTFVINEMIKIFDKLYDLRQTGGPIFEQYMRNAMLLVMGDPESGSTLMEIPKVLADPEFRRMKLDRCQDPTVVDFWRKEAEKAGGDAALANVVPYVTSKLTQFISNDMMRPIIAQQKSSFNLRDVMDNRKILLVNLAKGQVGEMNSYLLGMILVGKILMAALSRTDVAQDQRCDFYLYIDEFQNFTTDSICSILSEARKYNLNLVMAHQYIGQLVKGQDTSIRDAVFGNAGTWIVFKIGSEDAQMVIKEFAPALNEFDLINVDKYTAYVKLLVDNTGSRPFSMKSLWPLPGTVQAGLAGKIKSLSRLKYGQDRMVVEAEIMQRAKLRV